jgi:regulatory factor X
MPRLPADTAAFPPQDQAFESQSTLFSHGTSKGRLFADIYSDQYRSGFGRQTSDTYEYELKFATQEQMAPEDNVPIVLPDIGPYLPHRTDPDSADALVSLYRSHCTSLIDSVRYCKEKQFFRLFASFHGTLTVPVQKLFAQPELVGWIRECDWMMYQKMIRNVSQLTLQVAPPQVMKFLDNIEKQLRPHLHKVFGSLPNHILEARLEPATLFTHLLRQMLRVNQSAHAAARMLMQDPLRDLMWSDWNNLVNPKRVIENELPQSCGHEEVYNILKNEVRTLLLPLNEGTWMPDGSYHSEPTNDSSGYNNETVIDRIAAFVTDLSSRFPHAPARTILHCLNAISTAICREVTVGQGGSFNSWWLTKVFIDELGHWLSSLGGFLAHTPQDPNALSYSPGMLDESVHTMANGGSGSNNESRYSSIDDEFNPTQSFASANGHLPATGTSNPESKPLFHLYVLPANYIQTNPSRTVQPRRYPEQPDQVSFGIDFDMSTSQQEPNMDDSGIGMLDDPIESKFASIQRSLQAHISQLPANPIR